MGKLTLDTCINKVDEKVLKCLDKINNIGNLHYCDVESEKIPLSNDCWYEVKLAYDTREKGLIGNVIVLINTDEEITEDSTDEEIIALIEQKIAELKAVM